MKSGGLEAACTCPLKTRPVRCSSRSAVDKWAGALPAHLSTAGFPVLKDQRVPDRNYRKELSLLAKSKKLSIRMGYTPGN
jgi:hypothetical protein